MKIRAALWMLWLLLPVAALPKSHFVIVGGLGGEPRYAKQWADYVDNLEETCRKTAGDDSLVHALKGPAATREAIESCFCGVEPGRRSERYRGDFSDRPRQL